MRRIGLVIVAGVIGLGAVSCSNSMSKADFKAELDKAGVGGTVDTQCIVDKLEAKGFKFRKYGELSSDDQTKITEATTECVTASLGGSIPSVPKG
jgi:hypothetical protein